MATITTRASKGSALTFTEMDNNFSNLNTDKLETSGGTVTGNISLATGKTVTIGDSYTFPVADGSSSQILQTNGSGVLTFVDPSAGGTPAGANTQVQYNNAGAFGSEAAFTYDQATNTLTADNIVANTEFQGTHNGKMIFEANAAVALTKGDVVYISGLQGNTPRVSKAQANSTSTMPAFGIAEEDISIDTIGNITTFGSQTGLDVADFGEGSLTFALGDTVYVSSSEAGKLTNVAPAGESNRIQNIGKIERATPTTNVTIKVGGAGRSAATPALDDGNIFIGNGSNQSSTTAFAISLDATPELGGTLDVLANDIKSSTANVTISADANDKDVVLKIKDAGATLNQAASFNTDTRISNNITFYNGIAATGGSGSSATFDIERIGTRYQPTDGSGSNGDGINNRGSGYANDETLTIAGTSLGGASPANDLTITISDSEEPGVDGSGAIQDVTFSGTAASTEQTVYEPILDIPQGIRIGSTTARFSNKSLEANPNDSTYGTTGIIITNDDRPLWPELTLLSYGGNNPLHDQYGTQFGDFADTWPSPILNFKVANGDASSPAAIQNNDRLGILQAAGHDGTSFPGVASAVIEIKANETFSSSNARGAKMIFGFTVTGGSASEGDQTGDRTESIVATGNDVTINNGNDDVDFKVHGDTNSDILKVDAGTEIVSTGGVFQLYSASADPTSNLAEGQMYFNSTDKKFYGYNGTSWVVIGTQS